MARLVARTTDIPEPIGAEGFNDEADAIKRRRLQLEALLAEPKGMTGIRGGLANLALGITKGIHEGNLSAQEQDLAKRRSAAANKWLGEEPLATPAVEEQVGTGPLAPPPGTPGVDPVPPPAPAGEADVLPPFSNNMTQDSPAGWVGPGNALDMLPRGMTGAEYKPNRASSPMIPADIRNTARWAMRGAGFSPFHEAYAKMVAQRSFDQPEKARLAAEAIQAKKDAAAAADLAHERQKELQRIAAEREARTRAAEKEAAATKEAADKYERDRANAAEKYELRELIIAAGGGGAKGQGVKAKFEGYDNDGNRVFTRGDGVSVTLQPQKDEQGKPVLDEKGQPVMEHIVHSGEITPASAVEKAAAKVYALDATIKQSEAALKEVRENPEAFGFKSWITPQGKTGLIAKAAGIVTPEQLKAQTVVFRQQADIVHAIYGAALTHGEDVAKASWAPLPGEDDVHVARKLEAAIEYARRQIESAPRAAQAVARRRASGDTKPSIRNM